jgi:hypothetical protein
MGWTEVVIPLFYWDGLNATLVLTMGAMVLVWSIKWLLTWFTGA